MGTRTLAVSRTGSAEMGAPFFVNKQPRNCPVVRECLGAWVPADVGGGQSTELLLSAKRGA